MDCDYRGAEQIENCPWEVRLRPIGTHLAAYRQCLTCGCAIGSAVPKRDHPNAAEWDADLERRRDQERREMWAAEDDRRRRLNGAADDEWWAWYKEYLASPEWHRKRLAVMQRDGHRCRAGMLSCTGAASHVHHRTYERVGNEALFDLVSVCVACHDAIHDRKRER